MNQQTQTADRSDVLNLDSGLEALAASEEFRGPVEQTDHHCNDHFAMIYESREEQFDAVVPYIRQGLEDGERCMYVIDETPREDVTAALRAGGVDVDAALDSGALTFHGVEETYLKDGTFDPDGMIELYADAIEEATAEYEALRVTADTNWILDETTDVDEFLKYESRVNELFDGADCIALCQYNRNRIPPEILRTVIETHPHLICEGTACHNFYYTPPEEFFGPDAPGKEIDRMMGTLADRTEARTALQQRERDFRGLYEVTSDPDLDFGEKLARLLELGRERFDLGIGFLAHVDGDAFRVVDAVGSHDRIQPGDTAPLSQTYCRQLVDSDGPMGVADAPDEGWEDDPAYAIYDLDSYVGTTVTAGPKTYGTLCFADRSPRDEAFTDAEYTFLELMGQWLSYELDREERERYLREQNEITASPEMAFEEKLQDLFDLGCERFGLELGGMARVDPDEDVLELEHVSDDHDHVRPGETVPLSETYCGDVVGTDHALGITDLDDGHEERLVRSEFGLQSYLGTYVEVDGGDDRTFFFVSSEPRTEPFSEEERTFHQLMGQWVKYELERERRERRLSALNDASRDLMAAETATDVADCVVEAADDLEMPVTAAALWDEREGTLRPAGRTDAAEALDGVAPFVTGDGIGWRAFVENESLRESAPAGDGGEVTDVVAHPIGSQGVVVTGTTDPSGFRSAELEFAETVAANTSAAVCRAERERQLHERESTLAEQKESLERLRRINDTIRDIQQALVSASSRAEIAEVVCRHLADVGPYELAWVGDHDRASGEVRPTEWAGTEKGYLDEVSVTTGDEGDHPPTAAAVREREVVVVNELLDDPPFAPWRQAALSRGYHAAIALPIDYENSVFGVLTVYASESGVFDELERAVLTELSDTVAYAVNAVESKKALVSDELTELEFAVSEDQVGLVRFVRETGCEFVHENTVVRADGDLRAFFCTRGPTAAEVESYASVLPVAEMELLSEREVDGETVCRFEADLTDESITATVFDHGGRLRSIRADRDTATATVDLAADAETREFVEMFRSKFPSAELTAKRTRERSQRTVAQLRTGLTRDLTARQLETLQTAYFSGYFEKPRLQTGSEVAAAMEISQPTFNNHLRAAQRKLYDELFEAGN